MLPEAVEFPTQFHFTSARSKAVRITLTTSVEALIGIFVPRMLAEGGKISLCKFNGAAEIAFGWRCPPHEFH